MNILEQEDLIKGLDDRRLQEEAKRPTGQVPQFLVVSEIQRRTDMRKKYQDPSQQQPQGTVADQITQAGIASVQPPQMMQGQPMPMQGQPMPMQAYGGGMTPFMRKYAGGGVVRMQRGGVAPQDQMLALLSDLKGRGLGKEDVLDLLSSQSPRGGVNPSILDILDYTKSPLSQAFRKIYPDVAGTVDENLSIDQNLGNEFPNALIEDSNSASLDLATSGDPPTDGYVDPVSIDMPEVISKEMSFNEMLGKREIPESNYINNLLKMNSPESRLLDAESAILSGYTPKPEEEAEAGKEDASSDGTFSQIMSALNPFQSSGGRTASNMEGALVDSTLTRNRSFNEPLLTNPSTGRPLFGIESEKYLGLSPDQQRELDRQETVDSYKKVPRVDVPEGFIDIDGALRPIDSFTALSGSGLRAIQNKKEQDRIRALIAATPQTGPAVIEPEVNAEVDAEVSGDVVVKSAEETIKRARDTSSQSDIDAKVKQNRMASGASGLGNLFGLEGNKKQAFSMALMALGAGIAKGDTAGGLKDAGLAMNAINQQNLDREDKRLDRLGKAEDRTLRRLDIKDARAERNLIRAETKADRERRSQEQASYRLQTLMAAYIKERGSVDTQEQQIEYENKLRRGLDLPVLELNTGADVGLTGGNLSSKANGVVGSYSQKTGFLTPT
jgi:hypothetical protein